MRYTIGYFDDSIGPGGTTRYLSELVGALNLQRYRPIVFARQPAPWHRQMLALGAEIITLHSEAAAAADLPALPERMPSPPRTGRGSPLRLPGGAAWTLGLAREAFTLARLFRKRTVDILHTNQTGAEPAPLAARLAGIPRVLGTWHVDSTYDLDGSRQSSRHRLLERASMHALHYAISVSAATAQDWQARCRLDRHYQKRIAVIHNGIDVNRLIRQRSRQEARAALGLPETAIILGSLGRLDKAKGYEHLLDALPSIVRRHPQTHVAIAGRGPLEAQLRFQAEDLGVAANVHFLGFQSDVRQALEAFDIYVQPSLCEALGIGIIEAGAMGLPVVASRIGGIPEVVLEGETGLLVPARDSRLLSDALITLLSSADMREDMGRHAQTRVRQHFTCERMVSETMAVYEQLLCEKCRPRS